MALSIVLRSDACPPAHCLTLPPVPGLGAAHAQLDTAA